MCSREVPNTIRFCVRVHVWYLTVVNCIGRPARFALSCNNCATFRPVPSSIRVFLPSRINTSRCCPSFTGHYKHAGQSVILHRVLINCCRNSKYWGKKRVSIRVSIAFCDSSGDPRLQVSMISFIIIVKTSNRYYLRESALYFHYFIAALFSQL